MGRRKNGKAQFLTPQAAQAQLNAERPRPGRPSLKEQGYSDGEIRERQREQSRQSSNRYNERRSYDANANNLARDLSQDAWDGTNNMHSQMMTGIGTWQRNAYEATSHYGRHHRSDRSHFRGTMSSGYSDFSEDYEQRSRPPPFVHARNHHSRSDDHLDDRKPTARSLRHLESYEDESRAPSLASERDFDSVSSSERRNNWEDIGEFSHLRSHDGMNIRYAMGTAE